MNLIIDFSFVMYRSLFVLLDKKDEILLDSEESQIRFLKKFSLDLSSIIDRWSKFGNGKVILAVDTKKNWRKNVYDGYKGSRKEGREKANINFDKLFELIDTYIQFLDEKTKINVIKIDRLEADDIIFLVSKHLLDKGESSLTITSDVDLNQIICLKGDNFIAQYNSLSKTKKLFIDKDIQKALEKISLKITDLEDDILSNFNRTKKHTKEENNLEDLLSGNFSIGVMHQNSMSDIERLNKFITNSNDLEVEVVDPNLILFDKIIHGDQSDNIPVIFQNINIPKKYNRRDTKKLISFLTDDGLQIDNLYEYLKEDSTLRSKIMKYYKDNFKLNKDDINKIANNLKRNTQLVCLNEEIIPKELYDINDMVTKINKKWDNKKIVAKDVVKYILNLDIEEDDSVIKINFRGGW